MDYVFPAEIAALRAHKTGQFQERPVLDWIQKQNRKGVYIDAGAHIGNHSLFFLEHCPCTTVRSIEAHPTIYKLLEGNMVRNASNFENWVGYNNAVWSEDDELIQMAPIPQNNAGHCHVVNSGGRRGEKADADVMSITIDTVMTGQEDRVAVLKIDVEDVEEQAIEGAHRVLHESHPILIAERHNKQQLDAFEKLLKPYFYKRVQEWRGIHTFAWV